MTGGQLVERPALVKNYKVDSRVIHVEPLASLNPSVDLGRGDLWTVLEGEFTFTDPCHPKVNGKGADELESVRGNVFLDDELLVGGVVVHGGGGGVVHVLAHNLCVCEKGLGEIQKVKLKTRFSRQPNL